eukprot:jgi/Chlat1/8117/Chrsp75S07593
MLLKRTKTWSTVIRMVVHTVRCCFVLSACYYPEINNVMALAGIMLPSLNMSGAAALVHARVSLSHSMPSPRNKSGGRLPFRAVQRRLWHLPSAPAPSREHWSVVVRTYASSPQRRGAQVVLWVKRQWPPRPVQPAVKIAVFDYETVTDVCATAKKGHALDKYDEILLEAYDDQEKLLLHTTVVQELLERGLGREDRPLLIKGPETPMKAVRIWDERWGLRLVLMFSQDDLDRYLDVQGWVGLIDLDTVDPPTVETDFDMLEPTKTYSGANFGSEPLLGAQRVQQHVYYTRGKRRAPATAVHAGIARLARVTQATIVGDKVAYRAILRRGGLRLAEYDGLALLERFVHPRFSHVSAALVAYEENRDYGGGQDLVEFYTNIAVRNEQLRLPPEVQFTTEDKDAHYDAEHVVRSAIERGAHVVPCFGAPWLHPDIVKKRMHKDLGMLISTVSAETPVL